MDIISDMTRQFKSVEEAMTNKINALANKKAENEQTIKTLNDEKSDL